MSRNNYASLARATQTDKAKENQVKNNAGGYVFKLTPMKQLERFLILGSDSNTYYQTARKLTRENAQVVIACWAEHPQETLDLIVEISDKGRAPKNDPAIFAMALGTMAEDVKTRQLVYANLYRVCRTSTHLFMFVDNCMSLDKGFGRGLKRTIAKFYEEKDLNALALQLVKYRQREGFTHNRLIDLSHPKMRANSKHNLIRWVIGKDFDPDGLPELVDGFIKIQETPTLKVLKGYPMLPWEALPTEMLNDPNVWKHLLPNMGITALLRNLGKMSALGILKPLSEWEEFVVQKFKDKAVIRQSRLHPFNIMVAMKTYSAGHGFRGSNTWPVNNRIVSALEYAFYAAFDNVEPSGKRTLIGLDVSGSMSSKILNTNVSCREAAGAMAMVTFQKEERAYCHGFTNVFVDLGITPRDTLEEVQRKIYRSNFSSTNCSLPMDYAMREGLNVDQFVVYTDNETYAGRTHPFQALKDYRKKSGIDAKLVVVGMTSTGFSIADPSDPGMLDVVGFDTAAPALISNF